MIYDRRLIEDSLPLEVISEQSAREKSIRHGHISSIHVWWARRPLTAMRAAIFASLMPAPKDEEERKYFNELISRIVVWESANDNSGAIEEAHQIIQKYLNETSLTVLDPFMGGGSIAFEALRLNADVYAIDVNPLSYLIGWGTLVYPQRYGRRLIADLRNWGDRILNQVNAEIGHLYGHSDVGYLWTYQLRCSNPTCQATIPLIRNVELSGGKKNSKAAIRLRFDNPGQPIYEVAHGDEIDFDPVSRVFPKRRLVIQCPVCGTEMPLDYLKSEARSKRLTQIPIVAIRQNYRGESEFEVIHEHDIELVNSAEDLLRIKLRQSQSLIPNEPIVANRMVTLAQYGIEQWSDVYNSRQLLQITTFVEKSRSAYKEILEETQDIEYAKALLTYFAFAVDHLANYNSILSGWNAQTKRPTATFSRPGLTMRWDYFESTPSARHGWQSAIDRIASSLQSATGFSDSKAHVILGDAIKLDNLNLEKEFDLIVADPPYYDNLLYGDLTDYFYVWLKRLLSDVYPEAFQSDLTARQDELVLRENYSEGRRDAEIDYLSRLEQSFTQIHTSLKQNGVMVLLLPYHSSKAVDGVFQSIINAGFDISALWPFRTEISPHLSSSADLPSTLVLIGRKRTNAPQQETHFVRVRAQVRQAVRDQLKPVEGNSKANTQDLLIQAFGAALKVFTQYSHIMNASDEAVTVRDILDVAEEELADHVLLSEADNDH